MNKYIGAIVFFAVFMSGCVLTKIVTVPMRVIASSVVSVVPFVGDTADDAIDKAADTVDKVPL